jgi:hypothetical protein
MKTIRADQSIEAVNGRSDSSGMMTIMVTSKNVPANVSTVETALKKRTGRTMIPGVHRSADRYLIVRTRSYRAA